MTVFSLWEFIETISLFWNVKMSKYTEEFERIVQNAHGINLKLIGRLFGQSKNFKFHWGVNYRDDSRLSWKWTNELF